MGLKTVVLNSERMNYDGKLDLSVLSSEVKEYASTEQDQILERVQGMDVVVTKEMPVDGDTIARFPDSVQLICEAGTGYNNIDIEAARARGITVCNIPAPTTPRTLPLTSTWLTCIHFVKLLRSPLASIACWICMEELRFRIIIIAVWATRSVL